MGRAFEYRRAAKEKRWGHMSRMFPKLAKQISSAIDDHGEVMDKASTKLAGLRNAIIVSKNRVKEKLDSILHDPNNQRYFQENLVTMRGDRYVIPVKMEYKMNFPGIVHDQSGTGATLFIEPMAVVNLNNDIKRYVAEEREEVERILRTLSQNVGMEAKALLGSMNTMTELDVICAKAYLAQEQEATRPELTVAGGIVIDKGRHPLIDKDKVVPLDVQLGDDFNMLLITGPNTGGKTVSLKTVGLLTLMNQVGLSIPTNEKSTLGIFDDLFVDIGDEQNIQSSLSTFSSHLKKLINMVENTNEKSLILVDEIGNGTDPLEGETLAMALLEEFHNAGSLVLATTHYHNLKTFGVEKDYIVNCSMTFDLDSLKPTYKLINGVAGRSYAFEIATSLNLRGYIIDNARRYKDKYIDDNAKLVDNLEKTQLENEKLKDDLETKNKLIDERLKEIESIKKNLVIKKEKIENEAALEVEKLVNKYKDEMDDIMDTLKNKDDLKMHNVIEAKTKLKEVFNNNENSDDEVKRVQVFKVNDKVRIDDVDKAGIIIEINKDIATVNINGMRLKTKLSTLSHTDEEIKDDRVKNSHEISLNKSSTELNLIGMHVEEALRLLDSYLDSCLSCKLKQVRIIHGFGTGKLRNAVWNFLSKVSYVSKYYYAGPYDGGGGATIVEFK